MSPTSDPLAVAANAACGFKVLRCVECATAVRKALVAAGHRGQTVTLRAAKGHMFIVCPSYHGGQRAISQNGIHVGVRVSGVVFDNLHPAGIPFDDWLSAFDAAEGVEIVSVVDF